MNKNNGSDFLSWKETYQTWANYSQLNDHVRAELAAIADDEAQLQDAFYQPLEFGTAGMRGVLGAGINRMNIYTVRQATEGLARLMETLAPEVKQRGVAISYDSRHHSQEFAFEAAKVLGAHGIKSYVFASLRPTPELSFAVRHLHTYAGIMITASHNPKQYNGYKIYGEDGAQMPPKESDLITKYIRQVTDLFSVKVADKQQLLTDQTMELIGEQVDNAYLQEVKHVSVNHELINKVGKDMKLVFTPLHGTGSMLGQRALRQAGFENFQLVEAQAQPDPEFSTVTHPNPEFASAFDLAEQLGKKVGADLLIAVDPDADRLGAAVRQPDGTYALLTGNQLAALMLHYLLTAHKQAGTLPANAVAVKSIVSSEFATAIAKSFGVGMINVLTGFKFIAEQIHQYEQNHKHTFMFGFEESYGYLIRPFVRDKDAIQAVVLLAEVAAYYKSQGKNLYDGLQSLFKEYGYFAEKTIAQTFAGISGHAKIEKLMSTFRTSAPTSFGGQQVVKVADLQAGTLTDLATHKQTKLDLPQANVLKYHLADGSWVAVRPSGTEPKIKFYIGVNAASQEAATKLRDACEADLNAFIASIE